MTKTRAWVAGIMALWIVVAFATILTTAIASYSGAANAPFADEWRFTDPNIYLQSLFTKHHGHPFLFGRLGLGLDYYLFDARGWALRALTFVLSGLEVAAVVIIGRVAGLRSLFSQIVLGAFATVAIFNAQAVHDFMWGFQFTFVLAFVATAGAIAALAAYAEQAKVWKLGLSVALSVVATLSLANGVLTPLVLLLMSWRLRLPKRILIGFAALTALSWIAVLLMPNDGGGLRHRELDEIPTMLRFGVQLVGSAPGGTLAYLHDLGGPPFAPLIYSFVFGAIALVLALGLGGVAVFRTPVNPGRIGAVGLIAFALGTLALVAISRPQLSTQFELWSRYTVASGLLFIGLAILVASHPFWLTRNRAYAALTLGALAAALVPLAAIPVADHIAADQRARVATNTALVTGVAETRAVGRTTQNRGALNRMRMLVRESVGLRAHGKWLFADRWSRAIGQQVDIGAGGERACLDSAFLLRDRSTIPRGFAASQGRVAANETRAGRIVVIVDEQRVMTGYGLVARQPRDVSLLFANQTWQADWVGYAKVAPAQIGSRYTAYLASPERLLCQLGSASVTPPPGPPDGPATSPD